MLRPRRVIIGPVTHKCWRCGARYPMDQCCHCPERDPDQAYDEQRDREMEERWRRREEAN